MAMVFITLSDLINKTKIKPQIMMGLSFLAFMISSMYIIKTYKMYFTDRIFIVVLNWALLTKTLSYIYDKNEQKLKK
jgi:hypothetical protein